VVIDVVIRSAGGGAGAKDPRQVVRQTRQGRGWCAGSLDQIELLNPADRCPTGVHLKLVVDVVGVGPHSVQRRWQVTMADEKTSERCTAMPAATPSALAHVTLWAERVMSPAA